MIKLKYYQIATILFFLMIASCRSVPQTTFTGPAGEIFQIRIVADKLSDPWQIRYGPDGYLWITESRGYRVSRINPITKEKKLLLDLSALREFPRYDLLEDEDDGKPWPQGGLMSLALHPKFLEGQPYVYLNYIYHFDGADKEGTGCAVNSGGCFFTARLVRYTYDSIAKTLKDPEILCDTIPASSDHNGGRLLIAPVDGRDYLFYSIGELGAGQFTNAGKPNHAQSTDYYQGKILRFNLMPDNDSDRYDQWIPNDNPFNGTKQNAVWTLGHRNPQGLTYGIVNGEGRIYSSEHGPYSDDEINIIERGMNYGHPLVIGYDDGNYDGLAAGATGNRRLPGDWHTTYPTIISEKENAKKIGPSYRNPIKSLYPADPKLLNDLYNKIKNDSWGWPAWPSEAPSSIAFYNSDSIPGWKNSLLIPCLKGGKLIRLQLNEKGDAVAGDTLSYFNAKARYRDIALSPDGKSIYLATDSATKSSGPTRRDPHTMNYRGVIMELRYIGKTATP